MRTKKNRIYYNTTKKCRPSQKELQHYCKEHANTFNSFEEEYEKKFKIGIEKKEYIYINRNL